MHCIAKHNGSTHWWFHKSLMGWSASDSRTIAKLAADQLEHAKRESALRKISTLSLDSDGRREHDQRGSLEYYRIQHYQKYACKRHLEKSSRSERPRQAVWRYEPLVLCRLVATPTCEKYRLEVQPFRQEFADGSKSNDNVLE